LFLEGLDREPDAAIWEYARSNGYVIVTKDADFADMSVLRGHPPKVIWVRIGNCTTQQIEDLFRDQQEMINAFETDQTIGLLELI
jgi:predicted nuclease of predicted toxin-antitoxin system